MGCRDHNGLSPGKAFDVGLHCSIPRQTQVLAYIDDFRNAPFPLANNAFSLTHEIMRHRGPLQPTRDLVSSFLSDFELKNGKRSGIQLDTGTP